MKRINMLLGLVLLGSALPALSDVPPAETPQDYAYGMTLDTAASSSPWYRVTLPLAVYEQSVKPDLQDVRVFNQQGDVVPFSLNVQKPVQTSPQPVALRFFPLEASPIPAGNENQSDESVLLRSKNGVEVRLRGESVKTLGTSYLLALPEPGNTPLSIARLRLEWEKPAGNWQGSASVWLMRDLASTDAWDKLKDNVPLMALSSNGDTLKLDSIDMQGMRVGNDVRYLLLVLKEKSPRLTAVQAIPEQQAAGVEQIRLPGKGERVSDHEAIWRWTQPQPLSALQITLAEEGVLPVALAWRSSANSAWQPLAKEVIYRLDDKASDAIAIHGDRVEAIRMTSVNSRLPEVLPDVTGERDSYQLTFNAQGKAPYLLAWGNGAAQAASVSPDELIPQSVRSKYANEALPLAATNETLTLGGDARLSATSAAEQQNQWKTVLVWGALIAGVLLLAVMAWRAWREVKSDASPR